MYASILTFHRLLSRVISSSYLQWERAAPRSSLRSRHPCGVNQFNIHTTLRRYSDRKTKVRFTTHQSFISEHCGGVEFVDMLNEMRFGKLTPKSIAKFRSLSRVIEYEDGLNATELCVSISIL